MPPETPAGGTSPTAPPSALVRIAVTGRYFDPSKESFEDRKTEFITVFARRNLARNLTASVKKGQPLIVTGRLSSSEWKDSDGTQHISLVMQAEALGHDLSYGAATFRKPLRTQDVPEVDERTGEIVGGGSILEVSDTEDLEDDALTASGPYGGALATAS